MRKRRFGGLRVRLDPVSGEVNLRIPYRDLREVFTAAALNCHESIRAAEGRRNPGEARAYHQGLLAFVRGMESLLDERLTERYAAKGPPTVEQRRKAAIESKRERQLFDDMLAAVMAEKHREA